jgi:hypothetical protein
MNKHIHGMKVVVRVKIGKHGSWLNTPHTIAHDWAWNVTLGLLKKYHPDERYHNKVPGTFKASRNKYESRYEAERRINAKAKRRAVKIFKKLYKAAGENANV